MIFDMYEYCQMLKKNNLNIIYSGPLWSDGIEGIAGTLKKRLEFDELPLSSSQAIFSVFIEQMNNMLMYSMEKESQDVEPYGNLSTTRGAFILGIHGKTYFLQSGNTIKEEDVKMIKEKIDYLNAMDKRELRKYFKEQIKKENFNPGSKGAGLGLIEIARRSSSKIEYNFTPMKEGLTFFSMYVEI